MAVMVVMLHDIEEEEHTGLFVDYYDDLSFLPPLSSLQ